jgi:hypothetical protein
MVARMSARRSRMALLTGSKVLPAKERPDAGLRMSHLSGSMREANNSIKKAHLKPGRTLSIDLEFLFYRHGIIGQ